MKPAKITTLAALLLKLGIALEDGDRFSAAETRRELSERFGITVRVRRRPRVAAEPTSAADGSR